MRLFHFIPLILKMNLLNLSPSILDTGLWALGGVANDITIDIKYNPKKDISTFPNKLSEMEDLLQDSFDCYDTTKKSSKH